MVYNLFKPVLQEPNRQNPLIDRKAIAL